LTGRAFVTFIGKPKSLRRLDISHNPILNVVQSKALEQLKSKRKQRNRKCGQRKIRNQRATCPRVMQSSPLSQKSCREAGRDMRNSGRSR
jgi:hypothetical protein